ncbi:DUF58 domain-containing protein [Sphingomonas sp. ASY06-1R]|uniref:DUF58 domain-containing protein n=1 Tax=Sphingomonas sp. ASY06-1R TaxID=3445771 RepID=UPI003FA2D1F5
MISPTRLAIFASAAGVPIALLIGVLLPGAWYAGLAWPLAILLLAGVDALTGPHPRRATLQVALPRTAPVGGDADASIEVAIARGSGTGWCEVALANDPLLLMADEGRLWLPLVDGKGSGVLPILAVRRGNARVDRLWLRWKGPLGLVWKQAQRDAALTTLVTPDVRAVREHGARIFERHALQGLLTQVDRGDGVDFDALVEFRSGMDRRAIDWKQSARHRKLHAKEYRSERNSQIVFAVDSGRQMSEPLAGLPRVDRAVTAMLLMAWIVLKLGDRVALHAFDSRPRIASGLIGGTASFGELQRLAGDIDYSSEETNYTFALTSLATVLKRRSMIVLFTEFADLTSAEFMVRASARLMATHLLLVVVLRDEALEALVDKMPQDADDITRAVTSAALLRDRQLVLLRLRHLGAHVIESPYGQVAERLIAAYVDLKRKDIL